MSPTHLYRIAAIAVVLLLTSIVSAADAASQDRGATIFADSGYRGGSHRVLRDVEDLDDSRIGRDRASSIRVDRGCRVRIYDGTRFRGPYVELSGEVRDLGRTELGNDRARSIRVRCGWNRVWGDDDRSGRDDRGYRDDRDDRDYRDDRDHRDDRHGRDNDYGDGRGWKPPPYAGKPQGKGVALFRDSNFRGDYEVVYGDVPSLKQTSVGNDELSSLELDRGCYARLFEHEEFRGRYLDVKDSIPDLRRTPIGNDRVSSLQVRCRPWRQTNRGWGGVTLYRDSNFRGASETFSRDIRRLHDTRVGNDSASSIEVDPGCTVVLFEHADFEGDYVELEYDVENLRQTPVGNDRVTSLRVDCRY